MVYWADECLWVGTQVIEALLVDLAKAMTSSTLYISWHLSCWKPHGVLEKRTISNTTRFSFILNTACLCTVTSELYPQVYSYLGAWMYMHSVGVQMQEFWLLSAECGCRIANIVIIGVLVLPKECGWINALVEACTPHPPQDISRDNYRHVSTVSIHTWYTHSTKNMIGWVHLST